MADDPVEAQAPAQRSQNELSGETSVAIIA